MGWREAAFLKYLRGDNSNLDASSVPPETLPALQELAARAYMKRGDSQGQLLYADYDRSNSEQYDQVARTIGKTAPGNITREGNNWRIKDQYDFYSEGWDRDVERAKQLALGGDAIGTLSAMSSHVGKPYQVDMTVPMTPEQIKMFDNPSAIDATALQGSEFKFGGKNYKWKQHQLGRNDSAVAIASRQFAGNTMYKAQGQNLKKMTDMLYARNNGAVDAGSTVWIPEEVNNVSVRATINSKAERPTPPPAATPVAKANLEQHLKKASSQGNPTLATGISMPAQHNVVEGIAGMSQAAVNTVSKYLSKFKLP